MITILMSTYNGSKYISAQLDSILAQDISDWRIVVRDDGSTDDTPQILNEYALKDSRIEIIQDGKNMGAMRSFEYLLTQYANEGYIAFADQDDVWLPWKLRISMEQMLQAEKRYGSNTPLLVHSDLIVSDSNLHTIAPSFWDYSFIKPEVLNKRVEFLAICNSVTGCTMLLNQAGRKVVLPFGEKALMHDSAIAINIKKNAGKIVSISTPTMYYRQHGDNTLGALKYHFWRKMSTRYKEAKMHYRAYHPDIFSNKMAFIYWKMRCFFAEHL